MNKLCTLNDYKKSNINHRPMTPFTEVLMKIHDIKDTIRAATTPFQSSASLLHAQLSAHTPRRQSMINVRLTCS